MAQDARDNDLAMARFRDIETHQMTTFNLEKRSKTVLLAPGEKATVGEVSGTGRVTQLWMTFPGWFWQHWNTDSPVDQSILKTLILRIYWDGAKKPAVECPAGDFFGVGLCEVANFANRYFGMSSGGFFCKWPMPFREGFRVEVENCDANITTDVFMNVLYQLDANQPDDCGYFHAQFRTDSNSGPDPFSIAEFEGRGHYVGCALSMQGQDLHTMYFLEAPEYIHVDDDWETPRIVGTGLEDYFLGGWYFREGPFIGPYHGVPVKDPLQASIAMYRVHEDDAIHFRRRFRMDFVNPFDPTRLRPFKWSAAAFGYLGSPEGQGPDLPERDGLLCWYRVRNTDHLSIP